MEQDKTAEEIAVGTFIEIMGDVVGKTIEQRGIYYEQMVQRILVALESYASQQVAAANAQVMQLKEAGWHQVGCRPTAYSQGQECSCGWEQALADTEEK